jgi:hypothetical protein
MTPDNFSIVGKIGLPATLEQLAEECAELSQAALKLARLHRGENPTPVTEQEAAKLRRWGQRLKILT